MTKKPVTGAPVKPPKPDYARYACWGVLALTILLFAFVRFRLRDFPLERDEGEYAYVGQLLLQGIPPYRLAYNMKLPGTYAAYAAILAVFGQTPAAIHWGLIWVNAATTILVYLLAARLSGRVAGVAAGASYALLSAGQAVLGFAAHATHFVVLPALAGLLLLLRAGGRWRGWLCLSGGFLLGLAFLMKQPGFMFVLFGGLYLACSALRKRPVDMRGLISGTGPFMLGCVLPCAITCLALLAAGVMDRFWFWTFKYADAYGSILSVSQGALLLQTSFLKIVNPTAGIWIIAATGLTVFLWHPASRRHMHFIVGFLLFSFLAVCPGLYFRPHYFILLLPAVALLAGLAVGSAVAHFGKKAAYLTAVPILAFVLTLGHSVFLQSRFFFREDPATACREAYGANPFVESLAVAKYIRDHTSQDARIAVLGSEPQIYFYSGRHSATGFIYTYGLMENQKYALQMQRDMIREIEAACPEYVVFVNIPSSWARRTNSEKLIFTWADKYLTSGFVLEAVVEVTAAGPAEFRWGEEARSYEPRTPNTLSILRRKG
jgi:4-amino-4-deoxy-L-arabinose transferase-like glycosyltransferase